MTGVINDLDALVESQMETLFGALPCDVRFVRENLFTGYITDGKDTVACRLTGFRPFTVCLTHADIQFYLRSIEGQFWLLSDCEVSYQKDVNCQQYVLGVGERWKWTGERAESLFNFLFKKEADISWLNDPEQLPMVAECPGVQVTWQNLRQLLCAVVRAHYYQRNTPLVWRRIHELIEKCFVPGQCKHIAVYPSEPDLYVSHWALIQVRGKVPVPFDSETSQTVEGRLSLVVGPW